MDEGLHLTAADIERKLKWVTRQRSEQFSGRAGLSRKQFRALLEVVASAGKITQGELERLGSLGQMPRIMLTHEEMCILLTLALDVMRGPPVDTSTAE